MSDFFDNYFRTERVVPVSPADLSVVGVETLEYFRGQGYTVSGNRLSNGGWHISIEKGEWFRLILGMKTALNITIEPTFGGTRVSAQIGIFDLQVIPTLITVFVFTPVILGQIWGVIQQNQLDDEAVNFIEGRIRAHAGEPSAYRPAPARTAEDEARIAAERELGEPGY